MSQRLHLSFTCLLQNATVIYWHVYNDVITSLSQFMSIFTVPLTASWKETRIKTVDICKNKYIIKKSIKHYKNKIILNLMVLLIF